MYQMVHTQASECTVWFTRVEAALLGGPAMSACLVSAERLIDAPAEVVYHCLADYRAHHRVDGGFLPPAFTELQVLRVGVGGGTVIQFWTRIGGRAATRVQEVTEPVPGRVLKESGAGEGSTFTVEP